MAAAVLSFRAADISAAVGEAVSAAAGADLAAAVPAEDSREPYGKGLL